MNKLSLRLAMSSIFAFAGGTAMAAPAPFPTDAVVHAEDAVESISACFVAAANSTAAIADCMCAAGNGGFSFCQDGATPPASFMVHPQFAAAWAAEIETAETALSKTMQPRAAGIGEAYTSLNRWLADARGSCSLTQGSLELAVGPASDKTKLKGLLSAKATYNAVYMYPTLGTIVNNVLVTVPVGDPVRLCSLGQATVNAGLTYKHGRPRHDYGENIWTASDSPESMTFDEGYRRWKRSKTILNAALNVTEVGTTGGFVWAVPFFDFPYVNLTTPVNLAALRPTLGVKYLLVSAVGTAVLQSGGGKGINAIGVMANTKLTDRVLSLTLKDSTASGKFAIDDADPVNP